MNEARCPECGAHVASPEDVIDRHARYEDSQGGHSDRHTLVADAAERIIASD